MITRPTKVLQPFERGEVPQSQEVDNASCEEDVKKGQIPKKERTIVCGPLKPGAEDQGKNTQLPIDVQNATRDGDSEMLGGEDPKVPAEDDPQVPSVGNPEVPIDNQKLPSVGNPKVLTSRDDASSQKGGGEVIDLRKGPNPPVPDPNDTPPLLTRNLTHPE